MSAIEVTEQERPLIDGFVRGLRAASLAAAPGARMSGRELAAIGELAGRSARGRIVLAQAVAGALTAEQVAPLLGVDSTQAVYQRARRFGLLAIDHEGRKVFPAWQFDPDRSEIRPAVSQVLRIWRPAGVTALTVVSWFTTAQVELDGARPIDLVDDPIASRRLLLAARYAAAPFAH